MNMSPLQRTETSNFMLMTSITERGFFSGNITHNEEKDGFYCNLKVKENVVEVKVGENYRNNIDCYECFCTSSEYINCVGYVLL